MTTTKSAEILSTRLGVDLLVTLDGSPPHRVTYSVGGAASATVEVPGVPSGTGSALDMSIKAVPTPLPAGWTYLCQTGQITLDKLIERLSTTIYPYKEFSMLPHAIFNISAQGLGEIIAPSQFIEMMRVGRGLASWISDYNYKKIHEYRKSKGIDR